MQTTVIIPTLYSVPDITDWNIRILLKQNCLITIIDNTPNNKLKKWENTPNIKVMYFPQNIGVNPAWNIGVLTCTTKYYLLLNDDCMIWNQVIEHSENILADERIGITTYKTVEFITPVMYQSMYINQSGPADLFELGPWNKNILLERIGWFIFGRSKQYLEIPLKLKIFYGDDLIYKYTRSKNLKTVIDNSKIIFHKASSTTNKIQGINNTLVNERKYFEEAMHKLQLVGV